MNPYGNPFGTEPERGDPDRMSGKNQKPVWLILVMLVLIFAWGYFLFGRGGDDEIPLVPAVPEVPDDGGGRSPLKE